MADFFGDGVLLSSQTAKDLYAKVKDLPIVDYHCHLDINDIAANKTFSNVGEMWLGADHYKWRAMRMCGVDEKYITGNASWKEKFVAFASVMPKLAGNPLYYWCHFELKQVFKINEPLNARSAERIYAKANERLSSLDVKSLFALYKVDYVATTNNATDDLSLHESYFGAEVAPTFRPDKVLSWDKTEIDELGKLTGKDVSTLGGLKEALEDRLVYFVGKGCKISDHGFKDFPTAFVSDEEAEKIYLSNDCSRDGKEKLFANLLVFLLKQYKKYGILVQLHFSVLRNVNENAFKTLGVDSGFDVMSDECRVDSLIALLNALPDGQRPKIVLYSLNPEALQKLACVSGAFRDVIVGAAWWFNDTLEGIRRNLKTICEYSCLGTCLGMLTDSRSFLSYSRFDFFRRILADFVADKVDKGEYNFVDAENLMKDICYFNVAKTLQLAKELL